MKLIEFQLSANCGRCCSPVGLISQGTRGQDFDNCITAQMFIAGAIELSHPTRRQINAEGLLQGRVYVRDVLREKLAWPDLMRAVRVQYERHRPRLCLIEDRASGQSLIQALQQEAIPVLPVRADKSKLARTTAISGFVESGRVCLPHYAEWLDDFVEETAAFPRGTHDDQVDALVHGLTYYFLQGEQETVVEYEEPVSISPELDEIDAQFGIYE